MTGVPRLSVVIPTRERPARLRATLEELAGQDGAGELEVVVVDDGSHQPAAHSIGTDRAWPFTLRWVAQSHSGPAAARNRGVAEAAGGRVLLLGDDTPPQPGCVRAHLDIGAGREMAVQGPIDWHPEMRVTRVMQFLAPAGPQFYFVGLEDGASTPYTAVLGSNLSAPRQWLLDEPFDERFRDACGEDTEMAYRWQARGWRVVFAAGARCWHQHHYETIEPFLARQRRAGRAARLTVRLHPRLLPRLVLLPLFVGLAKLGPVVLRSVLGPGTPEGAWDLRCRVAFLAGFVAWS